ncbi:Membrane insertion protein OxaA/YidC [Botryosphaeria dothidea]|uniref:Membrane insertion protein OxaA/YidC n=1 Tax=Botryosphaeria dothidea TaxID=55169 RepID=A0A8H4J7E0_9PEZI|nr:Membrane insertion protein OxaA/YidC [Botryosphaeria dothidea]
MRPRSVVVGLNSRSLLGLLPNLRSHIYQNRPRRSLNLPSTRCLSSADAQVPPVMEDAFLNVFWGMFEILHNCGLSWAVAIPAGAVVIRGLVIMPWLQIPARKAQQQNAALIPLNYAYSMAIKHKCHRVFYDKGARVARDKAKLAMTKYGYQLRRRWRAERWRQMLPIAGFPVFIAVAEVIRRMAGCRSGLWGLIFGTGSSSSETSKVGGDAGAIQASDVPLDTLDAVAELKGTTSLPSPVPDSAVLSNWIEPSFATEGALWFPNLMLADPNMILPFLVSGLTMATLYRGSKPPGEGKEKPAGIILKRVLMTGALAIGPLTLQLPAGILLYWAASTMSAYLSHLYLDKFYPLVMPPRPCRRSVMYNPKPAQKAKR